jgi:hypothetical protein
MTIFYEFDSIHYDYMTKLISEDRFHINDAFDRVNDFCRTNMPQACQNCSNHPENGGSGICHCTLGITTVY